MTMKRIIRIAVAVALVLSMLTLTSDVRTTNDIEVDVVTQNTTT